MTTCVVILWIAVSIPTAHGFMTGSLFQAPCLVKLPELLQANEKEKMKEPEMGQVGVGSGVVDAAAASDNGNANGHASRNGSIKTRGRHKR